MMYVQWAIRSARAGHGAEVAMVAGAGRAKSALSVREACAILGVGRATLYDLIESGRLPAFRPGKRAYRIPGEAVEAFKEVEIRKLRGSRRAAGGEGGA
jgi:excisionase family DNA binding protein